MRITTGPPAYLAALDELLSVLREGSGMAELLDYFAEQLRGAKADPEGPAIEKYPSATQVQRALTQRSRALDRARAEWEQLSSEWQQRVPPQDEVMEEMRFE